MRTIFMGNPEFAIPTLKALQQSNHDLVAVVSNPPKPMGRGQALMSTAVGKFAKDQGFPLIEPRSLRSQELNKQLTTLNPDLFVVVAYKILPKSLIDLPRFGALNVHASLLPKYRGAGPIQWALMNGDKTTGVTVFQITPDVDTGDILLQQEIAISADDTMWTLGMRLCEAGAKLVIEAMDALETGSISGKPQDPALATPAPKITKEMTLIDWAWSAEKIHNWVRGLSPFPGMVTTIGGKQFRIYKTAVLDRNGNAPGTIVELHNESLVIATGDGHLSLLEVQIEGKKKMPAADFLRGATLKAGDRLGL
ncbi:MAG: methionyl-tRNA formyltransferase [Candidatus Neomarinimicrobiota bacterium]|jgi:methionyl-tRNA formyltransferase|nr:methionyl-tRNA formyltransferase [Candidatus Neomarinimicrobiota bacterium]